MNRGFLALALGLAAGAVTSAQAQAPSPSAVAVKPLVEAWRTCALDMGRRLMSSGETAETIAKVALYECRDRRQIVAEAMTRAQHPVRTVEVAILGIEDSIRDLMVSIIVQAKAK